MAIKSGYIVQRVGLELVNCPESRSVANESGSIVHKVGLWLTRVGLLYKEWVCGYQEWLCRPEIGLVAI